jgi:hypothetical protein
METTIFLDRIWPERVAGYPSNFMGQGQLRRIKGKMVQGVKLRASVVLSDDDARKIVDWMTDNAGDAYPFSFTVANLIVGVELLDKQLASV